MARTRVSGKFLSTAAWLTCCAGALLLAEHTPHAAAAASAPATAGNMGRQLPPMDPQVVQDQQDMTWNDYHPIPGHDWADPSQKPSKRLLKVALIAVDFPDQPFVITLPKKSDLFGNPQVNPIQREDVPKFYADFYNNALSELNRGHTLNSYWMEQSRGQYGVGKIDFFGPYRMPKPSWAYGLNEFAQNSATPDGTRANGQLEADCDALWRAEKGRAADNYELAVRIYAGYDESGVWQEFGEMKFPTKDDIPAEWGNPNADLPRWVATRYVPWTSWKAGAQQWGQSTIRQGENSGTITHEMAHAIFRIGDNNNNPYAQPYRRAGSGPWDLLDRGSFNGPGGPHNRWQVPAQYGASMPAGLMLRQKMMFGFVTTPQVLQLNRNGLAQSGLAVATVVARAVEPGPHQLAGIMVRLDGPAPADRSPPDDLDTNPLSAGRPDYNYYSLEVVQRIGNDSFCPDHGVLLAKNKDRESQTGGINGYNCFSWVIDAHPEDIHKVDFKRPKDGAPVMRTMADYRQLNDALFHVGLNSGSQFEWEDTPNRLHFYIIDRHTDDQAGGILSYTLSVRSLDGRGPQTRGVALTSPADATVTQPTSRCEVLLKNTGSAATALAPTATASASTATAPTVHLQADVSEFVAHDIFRLSVSIEGRGWTAVLQNALAAVKFAESQKIPVFVTHQPDATATATVTLKAVSESDPRKTATATFTVSAR